MAPQRKGTMRRALSIVAAALAGCVLGLVGFGLYYSDATSYLGSDPATCANCHVMKDQYASWMKGPHASVATCDDCHLPHGDVLSEYLVKIEDGALHGTKFTLGTYPQNIRIRQSSLDVTNGACLYCHGDLTNDMRNATQAAGESTTCTRCHANVGHQ